MVRLGRDEVPFAPSELALSTRGSKATATSSPPAASPPSQAGASPAPTAAKRTKPTKPAPPTKVGAARRATTAATRTRRAATAGSRRSTPPLTVTLRFRNDEWSVEAQRGARRLSKPGPLRPGAVSAFADHVDDEAIQEALVETVESCRAVVEERAAALRAQLQETEATLRDYEAKPTKRR